MWEADVSRAEMQQTVREFLAGELDAEARELALAADTPLLDHGLDLLGVLRLVVFLEEQFQIDAGATELRRDEFGTIERIADYVDRRARAT